MTRRLLPLLLLVACGDLEPATTATTSSPLLLRFGWSRVTIDVCFENRADAPELAAAIEQAAEAIWDTGSGLELEGWADCTSGAPGIHVRIASATAVYAMGDALDGVTDGVTIDRDPCVGPCLVTQREDLVRLHAALAFAQALGFDRVLSGGGGNSDAGYRPTPTMPCVDGEFVEKCAWPATLTDEAQDLRFARYGGNVGAMYAGRGRCLGAGAPGSSLEYAACADGADQRWPHPYVWQPPQFHMWLQAANGLCARPLGMPSFNEPIISYECGAASWTLSTTGSSEGAGLGRLQGADGCHVHQVGEGAGCADSESAPEPSTFRLDGPGLLGFSIMTEDQTACLAPKSYDPGARVGVRSCELDDPEGKWTWRHGTLQHTISGLCLSSTYYGALELAPCDPTLTSQRWRLASHLALDGTGFCLRQASLGFCPPKVDPSEEIITYTP